MITVNFPPYVHLIFEWLAYIVGFKLFIDARKNDTIDSNHRNLILTACIIGAVVGTKLFVWLENPLQLKLLDVAMSGKGIVGSLVGGWLGVEITKKIIGLKHSTGDITVIPLIVGIMIGRIGCFLTGLHDKTYGIETTLPWGVNFGDGINRHPAQLYEIVFLALLLLFINWLRKKELKAGQLFKIFMLGYISFRFFVQFIKPTPHIYWGLDFIQLMSLPIVLYLFLTVREYER